MIRFSGSVVVWLMLCMFFNGTSGCQPPPAKTAADMQTLMSEGNCAEIQRLAAEDDLSAEERGALAVCVAINGGNDQALQTALNYIDSNTAATSVQNAEAMLTLAVLHPAPTASFRTAIINVAMGTAGYGPLKGNNSIVSGSAEAQGLVVAILRYSVEMYFNTQPGGPLSDLTEIWDGCQALLNHSYSAASDYLAWQLFTSLAELALHTFDPNNKTEFGYALMTAAILTVEQNGAIAVAARCDMGTPYERLKFALSKDTALMGPLERNLAVATGCTRGKYAPQP